MICKALLVILPWPLRRWLLQRLFGYKIHASARIGLAWVYPKYLQMGEQSRIDHFTVAINLDSVELGKHSTIGRSNWITGFPTDSNKHFAHQADRQPRLILGEHSAITKHHYLDCTEAIRVGNFTTIAGHQTEMLTHSIDIVAARQDSKPIVIGDYCFVGTRFSPLIFCCSLFFLLKTFIKEVTSNAAKPN